MSEDIIPSIYSVKDIGISTFAGGIPQDSFRLRYGEIRDIYPPDHSKNKSKSFYEYDVLVQVISPEAITYKKYYNCMVMDGFGGQADFSTYTLRAGDASFLKSGSWALILCVEGNEFRGYIIGGERRKPDTQKGHHYEFEFNGVNFLIQDDGSWKVHTRGKTNINGKVEKENGAEIGVDGEGQLTVQTRGGQKIVVSPDGMISINSSDKVTIKGKDVKVEATTATIQGATVNVKGGNVNVTGSVSLGGSNLLPSINGVMTGSDIDPITTLPYWMLGCGSTTVKATK